MSTTDERDAVGAAYLAHLTDADLTALVGADDEERPVAAHVAAVRGQPALLLDVLDRPQTTARLLNLVTAPARTDELTFVSPFLVFAAGIHRVAADLIEHPYSPDRSSPRQRVPVFDGHELLDYLARPWRRLFLAELLASYTRVSSGATWTKTPRGWRRRRWNDLDPLKLAMLLDAVPDVQRAGVWRRLGDTALFLSGVFPDHVAARGLGGAGDARVLSRLTGLTDTPETDNGLDLFEWFGARWYRLAVDRDVAAGPNAALLRDQAQHFHQARRILNTVADRYLFPITTEWFTPPAR